MTTLTSLPTVEIYTPADPHHYSIDNRPINNLADRDIVLANAIDALSAPYYLSVKDFGAIGNGIADDTTAIQSTINAAILSGKVVYLPAGYYKITSPLMLYTASTFITVALIGEATSSRNDRGTIIDHSSMLTTPGIIVQGGRGVRIENIEFFGSNITTITGYFLASEWAVIGVRDQRYSPQCSIAVDPFAAGGVPADGGYPGFTAYYASSALASSRTTIKNCSFVHSVVGIFNGPNAAANNENNHYENVAFSTCKTCISFGQTQQKMCKISELFADACYTVIDTYTYSDRNGSAGFFWSGGDCAGCHSLVRTLNQVGAANTVTPGFRVDGVYAEGVSCIAWVGDAAAFNYLPGSFNDCMFWFAINDTKRADANLVNFADLSFNNCGFWITTAADGQQGHALKFYHESKSSNLQKSYLAFNNCRFMSASLPLFNIAALPDVTMRNCTNHSATNSGLAQVAYRSTFSDRVRVTSLNEITDQQPIWPGALVEDASNGNIFYVKQGMNSASLGNLAVTLNGFTATFTAADATTLNVGNIVYVTNHSLTKIDDTLFTAATWPLGMVTVAATSAITINNVSTNAPSGVQALTLRWYPFMHPASTIVTHSSTTAEITTSGTGVVWKAGDRVIASDITAGTYIVSGTSPNFILSKPATATLGAHRCYDADISSLRMESVPAVGSDVGDLDKTLTVNSENTVQRWSTTLTANRTATLSTTGAQFGDRFTIIRTGGGAFTLAVGGLAVLSSGQWCEVEYDALASAWVLIERGYLNAAERLTVSADVGDAGAAKTVTVGASERTQIANTTLTANRAVTLSTTNAYAGARFRFVRKAGASGASTWDIGTGPLKSLAVSQWCEMEYDGAAWFLAQFGSL